jgi:uncharacterized protein (TIGR03067 family)
MQEDFVDKQLPARPNLDHLRGQAKQLLARFKKGDGDAVRAFAEHLPAARGKQAAAPKLADAQSVVARQCGFPSWTILTRHIEALRGLEGEWHIARLEIDGAAVAAEGLARTRILIDGDRFRTESVEGTYEGVFTIDTETTPPHFDIHFVSGPDAGEWSRGIYRLDGPDQLTLCLGLVGSTRPRDFATRPESGHALELLTRASAARPANVTGGTPPPKAEPVAIDGADATAFEVPMTPLLERLAGAWSAVELVRDGKRMPETFLPHASRTMKGNELRVVVGGQTMVHAKVRIDERATPIAIDYLDLRKGHAGEVVYGILEWAGDEVRFQMAPAGAPRPSTFDGAQAGSLSRWRRK